MVGPDALEPDSEWSYLISFLPGLKSAGGTEQILRNTIGERVLGLPPEPRLDKGVPFSELRAIKEKAGGEPTMNFALSDEQVFLREAARGALSRFKTIEAAREALEEPDALPDLWPTAVEAGWPGLLIDEEHGGAGLGAFDALLVAEECGRVLASVPLLGLLPASAILDAAGDESLERGRRRRAAARATLPARPPGDLEQRWTVEPRAASPARRRRSASVDGETGDAGGDGGVRPRRAGGRICWSWSASTTTARRWRPRSTPPPTAVSVEPVIRYDATRSLGHVTLSGARGRRLAVDADVLADAWYLAQALHRRRVARRGADLPRRQRRLRQGALHVRARDRLLPGDQARADRGPAPAGERPRPAVLRRLGARVRARRSSRSPRAPPGRRPAARSTSPRAR